MVDVTAPTEIARLEDNLRIGLMYKIYRDDTFIGTSSTGTFVDLGVAEGSHTYKISTVDSLGHESPQSVQTFNITIDTAPPPAPTGLAVAVDKSKVTLTWEPLV